MKNTDEIPVALVNKELVFKTVAEIKEDIKSKYDIFRTKLLKKITDGKMPNEVACSQHITKEFHEIILPSIPSILFDGDKRFRDTLFEILGAAKFACLRSKEYSSSDSKQQYFVNYITGKLPDIIDTAFANYDLAEHGPYRLQSSSAFAITGNFVAGKPVKQITEQYDQDYCLVAWDPNDGRKFNILEEALPGATPARRPSQGR